MIVPTIGRVVLVSPGMNFPGHLAPGADTRLPALVCHVWNDRMINVGGFDSNGEPFKMTSLRLLQDDDQRDFEGQPFAEWMPYQRGQAAKYDELAAKTA